MAKTNPLPVLALGAAALFMLKGKDGSKTSSEGIPALGAEDVGFNQDYSQFEIGNSWRIKVLDSWLEQRRRAEMLVTKQSPGASMATMEESLFAARDAFMATHHAKVATNSSGSRSEQVILKNMPETNATSRFAGLILEQIDRFQRSEFDEVF